MNILIIGSGGREHALAWKIKQSKHVKNIFVAPGNAGTSSIAGNLPLTKKDDIIKWLKSNSIDLVIVGPDNYLADGLVDSLEALGIPVFGPTKAAAEIEWSKAFAKQFMKEEGIPTASYEVFTEFEVAKIYLKTQTFPLVIKVSGLAFGKGVVIATDINEAEDVLEKMMQSKVFGDAGTEVIIEEYLSGMEISVHAFSDGDEVVLFPPAQDHKRIFAGDKGPNTGGMGTIAPVPGVTLEQMKTIETTIVRPTITALAKRGRTFKGILFPGIIFTANGPKVVEFNARFGDPETQSYMRILESDLLEVLLACVRGDLRKLAVKWSALSACCVVCASAGYPDIYEKNKIITGLDAAHTESVVIFQAGTKNDKNIIHTNSGRVLGVSAVGKNLKEALAQSYKAIEKISFDGMQYRKDIGGKLL